MFDLTFHQVGQQIRDVLQAQANSLVHLGKDYPAYRTERTDRPFFLFFFLFFHLSREGNFIRDARVYTDNARFYYSTTFSCIEFRFLGFDRRFFIAR